jgi:hypothetical protein
MTTIACSLREIASDSKIGEEDLAGGWYRGPKLRRIGNRIFAEAGNTDEVPLLYEWIERGANPTDRPVLSPAADFLLLELSRDGIAVWTKYLTRTPMDTEFAAIGSGGPIALYLMRFQGMSPPAAVREACRVDEASEPPVYVATLRDHEIRQWRPRKK